MKYLTEVSMET